MTSQKPISLADPDVLRCPFSAYHELQENHPVYLDPVTGMYVVTRFEDLQTIARNTEQYSNDTRQLGNRQTEATPIILKMYAERGFLPVSTLSTNDPPGHTYQRALVDYAFRISRVKAMEAYIQKMADELVDDLIAKGSSADFIPLVAIPMPVMIIADQLGVERERMEDFKRWSDSLVGAANLLATTEQEIAMASDIIDMQNYLASRVEFYRENSGDNIIADLAKAEHEGKPLPMGELVYMLMQLLAAGNETTTSAMGMGMQLLIEGNYEDLLREQPAKMINFVEEVLRLHSPIQGLFRRTLTDIELHGVKIPSGSILMMRWAAGNRDPRKYENPDDVMLDRRAPMQHLTFGFGPHFCVGNALARAELRVMFSTMLDRLKNLRLEGEPEVIVHSFARGLRHLPIGYDVM